MSREFTGHVVGGNASAKAPHVINFNGILPHAKGRVAAMTEIATHLMVTKSLGYIPEVQATYAGAYFQDFSPPKNSGFVQAHRAMFSVEIGGTNLANYAFALSNPKLRGVLKAPQARTDTMQPVANYADRLLEISATKPTLDCLNHMTSWQRSGRKLEINALADTIHIMREILVNAHVDAIKKSENILYKRGWRDEQQIKAHLLNEGPQSPIVKDNLEFILQEGGPSRFGELPQIILAASQDVTRVTKHLSHGDIEQAVAEFTETASVSTNTDSAPSTKNSDADS